ncbi:MAG: T9SS type A sorting domain-containing protein [Chitinophagaceae bacterium]|nr:T9SS type A sorting domain-containing protein [Chitinophagaceae bacterium]
MKYLYLSFLLCLCSAAHVFAQAPQVIAFGEAGANFLGQQGLIDRSGNRVMTGKRFQTNDYPHIGFFDKNNAYKWSFRIDKNSATALKIIQTKDNHYVASFYPGIVLKFDSLGNIIWYKNFSNVSNWEDVTEDVNGDLFMVANSGGKMIVSKMTTAGNIVATYGYSLNPVSSYLFGRSIQESYDGNLIVCGLASYLSATPAKPVVLKINKSGGIIWKRVFACAGTSLLIDKLIESKTDHSFFGVGYEGTNTTVSFNGFSLKLDTAGHYVSNRSIGFPFHDTYYDVCEAPEGGFVAVGMSKPVEVCGGNMFYTKFSHNHDTLFNKVYGTGGGQGAFYFNIHNAANGGYYSFGTGSLWSTINIPYDYTLLMADAQLELPCKKHSQQFTQNILNITEDTNIVTGVFNPLFTDTYIKTYDSMIAMDACTGVALSTPSVNENTIPLTVFPNPAGQTLNIQTPDQSLFTIQMYSMDGQLIFQQQKPVASIQITTALWPVGIYILKVENDRHQIIYKKVQVEK